MANIERNEMPKAWELNGKTAAEYERTMRTAAERERNEQKERESGRGGDRVREKEKGRAERNTENCNMEENGARINGIVSRYSCLTNISMLNSIIYFVV